MGQLQALHTYILMEQNLQLVGLEPQAYDGLGKRVDSPLLMVAYGFEEGLTP